MNQKILHTPEGVRDIYNDECEKKLVLQDKLGNVLKSYGYSHIETPTFEFFDVFSAEVGTIPSKNLYKFFDRDGNTLTLRPDITPSIARASAKYFMQENMPIRLCYMGNTFINHSSYKGLLKETTQIGAELIGDDSVHGDAEMISLVIDLLLKAGLKDFQISIGQADFLKSLLKESRIDEETEEELLSMIANKNNFGVEELLQEKCIGEDLKQLFFKLPQLFGSIEILEEAKKLTQNQGAIRAIQRLKDIYKVLSFYKVEHYISFDLGMLSNHNYYTGIIFSAYTFGTGDAVVKGGRYDNLLAHFGKEAPSIGFSVEINQLMNALTRQKIDIPIKHNNTLILYKEPDIEFAISLTRHFRISGMNIELLCKKDETTLDDYKAFAMRQGMGGILYFEESQKVQVINVLSGDEQYADLSALLQEEV